MGAGFIGSTRYIRRTAKREGHPDPGSVNTFGDLMKWVANKAGNKGEVVDIPKDKKYPTDAVQCDACGGCGCETCDNRGWFTPRIHPQGRRCRNATCARPLTPNQVAVYCSNDCALEDR